MSRLACLASGIVLSCGSLHGVLPGVRARSFEQDAHCAQAFALTRRSAALPWLNEDGNASIARFLLDSDMLPAFADR